MTIEDMNALTLATADMDRAVDFYEALGFACEFGGRGTNFTTFRIPSGQALNLIADDRAREVNFWGRVIFHVSDVDAMHARVLAAGFTPEAPPRDAEWGERYFHLTDPDGHELSFARRL